MSIISQLANRHMAFCLGRVCEISLNERLVVGLDELQVEFDFNFARILNFREHQDLVALRVKMDQRITRVINALLQNCNVRPVGFCDIGFITYFAHIHREMLDYISQLNRMINDLDQSELVSLTTKGD